MDIMTVGGISGAMIAVMGAVKLFLTRQLGVNTQTRAYRVGMNITALAVAFGLAVVAPWVKGIELDLAVALENMGAGYLAGVGAYEALKHSLGKPPEYGKVPE